MFDLQEFMAFSGQHYPEHGPTGRRALCFASGSNRIPEIKGFSSIGIPVGLAAKELVRKDGSFTPAVKEIERLAGTGVPCFLDSGAFAEFSSGEPIQDETWWARLALYEHLAGILGSQLYVVAPDKVADQQITLERLKKFAPEMRCVWEDGAQVILPLQVGDDPTELARDEFQAAAQEILGFEVIPGMPMFQGMTPVQAVADFVQATRPEKIHLLALGAANDKTPEVLERLWDIKPDLMISQDAMILKSRMGKKGAPRKFDHVNTGAQQACEDIFDDGSLYEVGWNFTEEAGDPTSWLRPKKREEIAETFRLTADETTRFLSDPTGFMNSEFEPGHNYWENGYLNHVLDAAWGDYILLRTNGRRRAWVIGRTYDDHPAAHQFKSLFQDEIDPEGEFETKDGYEGIRDFCRENALDVPTLEKAC